MSRDSLGARQPGRMLPAGSQVVLQVKKKASAGEEQGQGFAAERYRKPGAVGVIRECPARVDGLYVVEFTNGETVTATCAELVLRRTEVEEQLNEVQYDLSQLESAVIYRCVVGSRAFGLAGESSDEDVRGIYQAPAEMLWSLYKPPEQIEKCEHGEDVVYWELEKFLGLALKANPNVLEVLWSPHVLQANAIAQDLLSIRRAFLSKHLYKTYSGYVLSQFRRMKNSMERQGDFKRKHAMHLIRLLLSGLHVMRTGEVLIDVGEHRDELLRIRKGETPFDEIKRRAMEIDSEFQAAFEATDLPEQPDFSTVNNFLIDARRRLARES